MDQKQTLRPPSLLLLPTFLLLLPVLLLLTSPNSSNTMMTQAAPAAAAAMMPRTQWVRDKYCSATLLQTADQEKNCAGAPLKFMGVSRSLIHLLCCLGSFSTMQVRHNYTRYLDPSLVLHIVETVRSPKQEEQVAKFVRQCHGSGSDPSGSRLLHKADFEIWQIFSSYCRSW